MVSPQKLFRIIGLALCAVWLAGCGSLTRLTYNQADELLYWWLHGYVDFTQEQAPRVRADLAALQQWHRSTQLPQYAELLQSLQPLTSQTLSAAQACSVADDVRNRLTLLGGQIEPLATWMAVHITPEQIEHLQHKYAKTNEEFDKEWRKPAASELRKNRIKQARSRYEMLYGKLDDAQMAVVAATIDQNAFDVPGNRAERLRRQQDVLQTLRKIAADKASPAEARSLVHGLLERSLNSPNPAWRAHAQAQWQHGCESFARVHNSTTPAQRAKALATLRDYEADFRALAAKK